jgi:hypothetical protein
MAEGFQGWLAAGLPWSTAGSGSVTLAPGAAPALVPA